jgi:hypothetical protein
MCRYYLRNAVPVNIYIYLPTSRCIYGDSCSIVCIFYIDQCYLEVAFTQFRSMNKKFIKLFVAFLDSRAF